MTRILICITVVLVLALPAAAREVLVVQGVRSAMYDEALKGFRSTCSGEVSTLVLSDYANPELARVIQEERPRVVVALGDRALAAVRKVRTSPVLSMLALGVDGREAQRNGVAGVSLFVKPEQYLNLFGRIKAAKVGLVYDPARTGWYVRLARAAAKQYGIELVLREVSGPRQVLGQLRSLKGAVDSLWLIPDATAVTTRTIEGYFLFAQSQSLPVISFSTAQLKLGAMVAVEADPSEQGKQTGELAQQILSGIQPAVLPVVPARKVIVRVNDAVARRLRYSAELAGTLYK